MLFNPRRSRNVSLARSLARSSRPFASRVRIGLVSVNRVSQVISRRSDCSSRNYAVRALVLDVARCRTCNDVYIRGVWVMEGRELVPNTVIAYELSPGNFVVDVHQLDMRIERNEQVGAFRADSM